ncbi:MAG: hypothetical protein IKZ11_04625 [Alistipes sp.]|nr:hypothetical protein [Alistipes sp.]
MTNPNEDYTSRGWQVVSATLLVLLIISLVPPISAGGIDLRRANIISDLVRFETSDQSTEPQPEINVEEFEIDLDAVAEQVAQTQAQSSPTGVATSASWEGIFEEQPTGGEELLEQTGPLPSLEELPSTDYSDILPADSLITRLELFTEGEMNAWNKLYEKLLWNKEQVRIAFMGDSFVEGDILTADLRERLQDTFHGGGVGYAPVASPFTGFRQTIKTTSKGWTPYNIMQRKSTPEPYASDFFLSGWVAKASAGASTRWDMTDKRRHLSDVERARLLFIARQRVEIGLKLNDGEERVFFFDGNDVVRQIVVEQEQIRSLEMTILSGAESLTAIGAEFDSKSGVAVDNLSIRSNNGQAMFWSNASINSQINTMRPYDLVILQYGLNIMSADRHNYSLYGEQVEKMISYVESCFPGAAVLVMGVSDRSQKGEDGIKPMESAKSLTQSQRQAAQNRGTAFWDTYSAMQRMGGMTEFVNNGWAGKDYTHINYAGGARIARELYYAILKGAEEYCIQLRDRIERSKPVLTKPIKIEPIEHRPLEADMLQRDTILKPEE